MNKKTNYEKVILESNRWIDEGEEEKSFENDRPLFDYIDDVASALENYYEYCEGQAKGPEEFESLGDNIGIMRQAFANFVEKAEDAFKDNLKIMANSGIPKNDELP